MELFIFMCLIVILVPFFMKQKAEDVITLIRYSDNGFESKMLNTEDYYFYDKGTQILYISGCHVYVESDKYITSSFGKDVKKNVIRVPSNTVVWSRNITYDKQTNQITKLQSSIRTREEISYIKRTLADVKSDINKRDEAINQGVFNIEQDPLGKYLNVAIVDIKNINNVQKIE